jgi:hypothetical protein
MKSKAFVFESASAHFLSFAAIYLPHMGLEAWESLPFDPFGILCE